MGRKGTSKYEGHFSGGEKHGEWTVASPEILLTGKDAHVLCSCSCGQQKAVSVFILLTGKSTRCDECRRIESSTKRSGENNGSWKGVGAIPASKFKHVKDPTTRQFLADLWDKSDKHCALTGVPLDIWKSASPDRIDSSNGYIPGNVQWVHKDVNLMKNAFDVNYFIETCKKIAAKHT